MCGIFGYVGAKDAAPVIINGLKRLEYRGYDSWGIAVLHANGIMVSKKVGAIGELAKVKGLPESHMGIGHTRWATHGGVTEHNAHPHFSGDRSFVVAQNGIVENYQELKGKLKKRGYRFDTETDTEVIVRLIEDKLKGSPDLKEAVRKAFLELSGRNTIIVLSRKDEEIIAIRHGSPLVVGLGNGEYFFASDTLSFADRTSRVIFVNDLEMVEYRAGRVNLYGVKDDRKIPAQISQLGQQEVAIDKKDHDSFYIKEVLEQPHTIREAALHSEKELAPLVQAVKKAGHVYTLGAGTASYAAGQGAYFLRTAGRVKVTELKSYETKSYLNVFKKGDVMIAVSQSGETADTLEAAAAARQRGVRIASIVNMMGSTLTRESDFPFLTRSGPEISVVSTKAFTAQISFLKLLSYSLAGRYWEGKRLIEETSIAAEMFGQSRYLKKVEATARTLMDKEHVYVLGRDENYYLSLEGALKIKEISYIHAEGFSAGELKHGVIALIEKGTPVIGILPPDGQADILSALAEVRARGAWVLGIAARDNELLDDRLAVPEQAEVAGIVSIIPFQLLGYYLAKFKGFSPDKPRNLAKSVTVK